MERRRSKIKNDAPAAPVVVGDVLRRIGILNHQRLALGATIGIRSVGATSNGIDARVTATRRVRRTQVKIFRRGNTRVKDIDVFGYLVIVKRRRQDRCKSTVVFQFGCLIRTRKELTDSKRTKVANATIQRLGRSSRRRLHLAFPTSEYKIFVIVVFQQCRFASRQIHRKASLILPNLVENRRRQANHQKRSKHFHFVNRTRLQICDETKDAKR